MTTLLAIFANNLLPIFLAMGVGYLLGKYFQVNPRTISQAVFYVFTPCLIFHILTLNQVTSIDILKMVGFATLLMVVLGLIAYFFCRLIHLERRLLVAVLLTTMFVNAGNLGIPLVDFAFGKTALAYAMIYFITNATLTSTAGVFFASLGSTNLTQALLGIFKVPAIYSVSLAILFLELGWQIPLPLGRAIELLGNAAVPCMLILLGLQFQVARWAGNLRALLLANSLRLLVAPILALTLSPIFGLIGSARQAGVVEAAMPPAVLNTVLATEYDVEPSFVTFVVFVGTILSPFILTPLLAILGA